MLNLILTGTYPIPYVSCHHHFPDGHLSSQLSFYPQTALTHSSDLEDAGCLSVELVPVVIYH